MDLSGFSAENILDFSANINPMGLPEWFRPVVSSSLSSVVHYPDPESSDLAKAASERYGCSPNEVLIGNGSSEILYLLPKALGKKRAIILAPSYVDYANASEVAGLELNYVFLKEIDDFVPDLRRVQSVLCGAELVFICTPNNPTGLITDAEHIREIATSNPSTLFIVDEAFGDFVENMDSLVRDRPQNVIVLLSLTKIYSIPGLRLGLAICESQIVESVRRIQPMWSVNSIAQAVGSAALRDTHYVERSRMFVLQQREILESELKSLLGLTVYPGKANFLFVRIDRKDLDAIELARRVLQDGIAIRVCENFQGLDNRFFRIAVKTYEQNMKLSDSLRNAIGFTHRSFKKAKPPALMFQGTSSNAGKSILTAALGRIMLQDGYKVAPFKSQNMSLNSYVTRSGGEMGRAQVLQAQACRLEPDVRMNPILLKPNSDTGSQIIVCGKPVSNMNVMEYVRYKTNAFAAAKAAYDSLSSEFDVMVLEGAGSPGEVNLKHHDIVNMQMARYANARVFIVGDIDRGGVFASFVGTMEVLAEWERAMVAGFVVNRFRGDKDLLDDALNYILLYTGQPVIGVVPYLKNLGLPEEDSVSFKSGLFDEQREADDSIEVAIIDLPHISNFTDFDAFRTEPDVRLKIVRSREDLNQPDAVILPGSKNTIGDLEYIKSRGIDSKLRELVKNGIEIIGICGGFQMLGGEIADPYGLESGGKSFHGLNFINATTVLAPEKTLTRVSGLHLESNLRVRGYEIHHGQSQCVDTSPIVELERGRTDGARSSNGRIWGTYLHGIFDADEFRRWFIDKLRQRRGLQPKGKICSIYDLEPALDRLAESVRQNIDISRIYRLIGIS